MDVAQLEDPDAHVQDLTLREVQALRFRETAPELVCGPERARASAGIPTLRAALELCKKYGVMVTVELKGAVDH